MKRICVFGASITSGWTDTVQGGWCDLLKCDVLKNGIFVFNLGISGNDTNDLLKRLDNECKVRRPNHIIIGLGTNDSKYYLTDKKFQTPIEDFENNLNEIIKISKLHCNNITLIGLTRVDEETINLELENKNFIFKNKYLEQYDNTIKEVANKNKVKFIPTFDLDVEKSSDGLHPNSNGHKMLFNRIKKHINFN